MPYKLSVHNEVPFHVALGRIRDMAQTILAESNDLLAANNSSVATVTPESSPELAHAKEVLRTFRNDLRESRQTYAHVGVCAMECLAREAKQVLQRAMELGAEWSEASKQSLADQLLQAQAEAEQLAVQLIQAGLGDFIQ